LNGLQPLAERLPVVLAPKTIDNDLGLNYPSEPDEWVRANDATAKHGYRYKRARVHAVFDLDQIVNYVTPGYATAVFVSASGVERIRTTAESHRRIAIIEVMGRHSGYIALGTAYGQPDIILIPEHPLDLELLVERVKHLYDLQKNVVIVCGEGIVDEQGRELGAETKSTDPSRQHGLERRGGRAAREADPDDWRPLFPALPPRRIGEGSDLHPQSRPHAARRPADSVRPVLRRAAGFQGR
jgi:6-phosphofructokinase